MAMYGPDHGTNGLRVEWAIQKNVHESFHFTLAGEVPEGCVMGSGLLTFILMI